MANTPSSGSGTDIETLKLGVDTSEVATAASDLDKLGTATIKSVKSINDLSKAVESNSDFMARSNANYENKIQILQREWDQEQKTIKAAQEILAINEAIVDQGTRYIAKLEEMVATYNMSTAALQRYKAEQLGVAAEAAPLIAAMEEMRIATLKYGVTITEVGQIEAARIKWEEANMTALNAQRQRMLAEQTHLEESAMTSLNAQRIRMMAENRAAAVRDIEEMEAIRLADIEKQKSAMIAFEAFKRRTMAENRAEAIRLLTEQEETAVKLAEKQAIEEIKWAQMSVKARIAELERLKAYQASSAIRPETISNMFSSAAIADLPNLQALISRYNETLTNTHGSTRRLGEATEQLGLTFSNNRARTEMLVLAHEALQGRFTRMPGSLMVLGEYTNAASLAFTGMGAVMLGVVGTLGFLAYSTYKGVESQKAMTQAVIMTGHYSQLTADGLNDLAHAAVATGGSLNQAKEAVVQIAASGKFTREQIGNVTDAVVAMEHATGQSIGTTIKQFESLAVQAMGHTSNMTHAVGDAALKLDNQYHFLNTTIYEQIVALEKEGKAKEASSIATNEFARVVKERAHEVQENVGYIQKAWDGVKNSIMGAVDAAGNWGKRQTPKMQVDSVSAELAQFDANQKATKDQAMGKEQLARVEGYRSEIVNRLITAVTELNKVDAEANKIGAERKAQSDANHAIQENEAMLLRLRKKEMTELNQALEAYRENNKRIALVEPNADRLKPENVARDEELIIKSRTEKVRAIKSDGRKAVLQDELADYKSEYKQTEEAVKSNEKLAEEAAVSGRITRQTQYDIIEVERNNQLAGLERMKNAEMEVLRKYQPMNDNDAKINITRINGVARAYDEAEQKITDAAQLAQQKVVDKAVKADTKDQDKELNQLIAKIDKQKEFNATIGKTQEEKELALKKLDEEKASQEELELILLRISLSTDDLGVVDKATTEAQIDRLEKLLKARQEYNSALDAGAMAAKEAAIQKEIDKQYSQFNKKLGDDLASAIVDGGGKGVQKLIRDMEISFAKMVLRPILDPITNGISSMLYPNASTATGIGGVSGSGGVGGAIGLANAAANAYKMVSNGLSSFNNMGATIADNTQGMMYQAGLTKQIAGNGGFANAVGSIGSTIGGYVVGSGLNSAISGQYQTGSGVQTAEKIATAVASYFSPVAGAVVGAISGLINRAFGMGPKNVTSVGMSGTLSDTGVTGQNYSNWHQDGGWFRSDKNGTDTSALDTDVVNSFTSGFAQMKAASTDFAKNIGITSNTLDSYSKNFDIKLTTDATANQKAITDFFTTVGDEMALQLIPNLNRFTKSGETASVTLQRLSDTFKATDAIAMSLGYTSQNMFKGTGLDTASARERIITASGGASNATSQATVYAQNFLTESQKLAPALAAVNTAMESMGYYGVTTRKGFADLVDGLVSSGAILTDSGAKQYASLMSVAGAFATTHAATQDLSKSVQQIADETKSLQAEYDKLTLTTVQLRQKERALISDENKVLYDQVKARTDLSDAYKRESDVLKQTIADNKAYRASLLTFRDSLTLGSLSGNTPTQALTEAHRQYTETLAKAKTGDKTAMDGLTSAATAFLQADQVVKASSPEYMLDKENVLADLKNLADFIGNGQTQAELQLASMDKSVGQLISINEGVKSVAQILAEIAKIPAQSAASGSTTINSPLMSQSNPTVMPRPVSGFVTVQPIVDQLSALRAEQDAQNKESIVANAIVTTQSANVVAESSVSAVKYSNWKLAQAQGSGIDQ